MKSRFPIHTRLNGNMHCQLIIALMTLALNVTMVNLANAEVPAGRFVNVRPVPGLTSPSQDASMSMTSDQLTIYFTSFRPRTPQFPPPGEERDIWIATRDFKDDRFDTPTRLDEPISLDGLGDYDPFISNDGLSLYFQSTRESGLPGDTYPWVTHRESPTAPWGEPELFIGAFNTFEAGLDVDVSNIDFSADELVVYFQTRRNGNYDIYQTRRASLDEPFGAAESLVGLNTDQHGEWMPSVSSDGLSLFYVHRPNDVTADPWERIWIVTRSSLDEQFSAPVDINEFGLGSSINRSGGAEFEPFITSDWPADGSKLYYAFASSPNWTIYEATWSLPCDLDQDGQCNVDDLDSLSALNDIQSGVPVVNGQNDRYDLNDDQVINTEDVGAWLSTAATANRLVSSYLSGDANLDGSVDAADLNALGLNWNQATTTWSGGDFDSDGFVDAADLNLLALNWQQSLGQAAAVPATVPEPSSFVFLICAIGLLGARIRRMLHA